MKKNITYFDDISTIYFSRVQIEKIDRAIIGIAGCGGLGSNCAMLLARCGFKKFYIVDFDHVEPSNLNRQAYYPEHVGSYKVSCLKDLLLRLNPLITIYPVTERLTAENCKAIFEPCSVIVEAFDKADCKAMIVESFLSSSKLVVSASGLAGIGSTDTLKTTKLRENFILIGDGVSAVNEQCKPYAPRVMVAAAKQADAVLEWVLDQNVSD